MKIGIIGAGNIGKALAVRLVERGHQVTIGNSRGPQSLNDVAQETGATPGELKEVVSGAALIVVTIPEKKVLNLPKGLFADVPASTVIVDTGNYYPRQRDGRIEAIEGGMMESAWVAEQIGRPVLKAFNNIYAVHLRDKGQPEGTPNRIALPVSGDSAEAKKVLMQLINEIGFDAVDNGGIDNSWRQQPGSPAYGTDFDAEGVRAALQRAERERQPDWSGTENSPGSFEQPA